MIHLLLIVFCLLSFSGQIFGSEMFIKEIVLHVEICHPTAGCLQYSSIKNRQACQYFGIESEEIETFLPLLIYQENKYENNDETEVHIHKKFAEIHAIPYRYFIDTKNKFKKKNDEISLSVIALDADNKCQVKLLMFSDLLSQYDSISEAFWLNEFKQKPGFALDDKKELIDRGLITADGAHGPNGYRTSEESELIKKSSIDTSPSYSYLKNPFLCLLGLGGLIAIVAFYQKFYGAVGK